MRLRIEHVFMALAILVLFVSTCFGAEIVTESNLTFENGVEKEVRISMPDNCSSMQGVITVSNATLISLAEEYSSKDIDINGDKFILYGMNDDVMEGANLVIKIMPENNSNIVVGIVDCMGATPDAEKIDIDDFGITLSSTLDLNGDGLLNADDVTFVIGKIFDGNLNVADLQNIINAVLAEM